MLLRKKNKHSGFHLKSYKGKPKIYGILGGGRKLGEGIQGHRTLEPLQRQRLGLGWGVGIVQTERPRGMVQGVQEAGSEPSRLPRREDLSFTYPEVFTSPRMEGGQVVVLFCITV